MVEDHINTALSAFGGLDVILRRCTEAFAFWQRLDDYNTFPLRLSQRRAQLDFWARGWGVESKEYLKNKKFSEHQTLVTNYLQVIHHIIRELGSDDTTTPIPATAHELLSMSHINRLSTLGSLDPTAVAAVGIGSTSNSSKLIPQKLKWALQEKRVEERLALVDCLIHDLLDFLPPPSSNKSDAIILDTSLQSQDPKFLAQASLSSDSSTMICSLLWLRSMVYRTDQSSAGISGKQLILTKHLPSNCKPDEQHYMTHYEGSLVYVEQKEISVPRNNDRPRDILKARIENIALRLQHPQKPTALRTLPCKGVVVKNSIDNHTMTTTYKIVYEAEASKFFSLRTLLSRQSSQNVSSEQIRQIFPLGRRFVMAQVLSRAVMYLHLSDWLHKGIRSSNVLFFAEDAEGLKSALPYLVGFEYSRPDSDGELTEHIVEKADHRFYRHPRAPAIPIADFREPLGGAGRFSKAYDIYSLGVVLVELGLFESARGIVSSQLGKSDVSARDIQKVLLDKGISKLKFKMGELYANAARVCLDGFFDSYDKDLLAHAFYTNVVQPLESCKA